MNFFKEFIFNVLKNYFVWIIIIFEFVAIIILTILLINKEEVVIEPNNEIAYVDTRDVVDNTDSYEYVIFDIKGAIKYPGVYKVLKGTIINDAITLAGGLNSNATTLNINLGKEVIDRMVIYISTKNELTKKVNNDLNKVVVENTSEKKIIDNEAIVDNSNCVGIEVDDVDDNKKDNNEKKSINSNDNKKEENSSKNNEVNIENNDNNLISINKAKKDDLIKIPGIGEGKAEKIIDYRNKNGLFKDIEDIKNVSGIGDSLFEKIKDYITI